MSSTPVSLRLDPAIRARLEAEARRAERPVSQVAQRAIAAWLDAQEELRRQIDAAVEEADRGVFVSRERVATWMEGWGTVEEGPVPEPDVGVRDEKGDTRATRA